ncbi:hypothetical protein K432DRAFT_395136, partial [Lepidopterella palustris CBS 459.81]
CFKQRHVHWLIYLAFNYFDTNCVGLLVRECVQQPVDHVVFVKCLQFSFQQLAQQQLFKLLCFINCFVNRLQLISFVKSFEFLDFIQLTSLVNWGNFKLSKSILVDRSLHKLFGGFHPYGTCLCGIQFILKLHRQYLNPFVRMPSYSTASSSTKEIITTVITTDYVYICPTGLTTSVITHTVTYCPAEQTPGGPPPGFTTTVTVCMVCGPQPTTVTLTLPTYPATTTAASPSSSAICIGTGCKGPLYQSLPAESPSSSAICIGTGCKGQLYQSVPVAASSSALPICNGTGCKAPLWLSSPVASEVSPASSSAPVCNGTGCKGPLYASSPIASFEASPSYTATVQIVKTVQVIPMPATLIAAAYSSPVPYSSGVVLPVGSGNATTGYAKATTYATGTKTPYYASPSVTPFTGAAAGRVEAGLFAFVVGLVAAVVVLKAAAGFHTCSSKRNLCHIWIARFSGYQRFYILIVLRATQMDVHSQMKPRNHAPSLTRSNTFLSPQLPSCTLPTRFSLPGDGAFVR